MPPKKRKKPGPVKRKKPGPRKRLTKVQFDTDCTGRRFKMGQRAKFNGGVYVVEDLFVVPHPDGRAHGMQEIVYFRNRETRALCQIHGALVTILSDAPRKRTTPRTLRQRRRRLRRS